MRMSGNIGESKAADTVLREQMASALLCRDLCTRSAELICGRPEPREHLDRRGHVGARLHDNASALLRLSEFHCVKEENEASMLIYSSQDILVAFHFFWPTRGRRHIRSQKELIHYRQ